MLKFIFILISVFVLGFLIINDTWMISVEGFGYQVTASSLLFIVAIAVFMYVIHLLKKPFHWMSGYQKWAEKRRRTRKETYFTQILQAVLEQKQDTMRAMVKQRKNWFAPKSTEALLIEALFDPTPHVFEQLIQKPETELAGIRGLLQYAQKTGDTEEALRLLRKAAAKNPKEPWIYAGLWDLQVIQSDWADALKTLDVLKGKKQVSSEKYRERKACLLLKLGRAKEAFGTDPDNPATAIAYARIEPKKARDILSASWKKNPCWDTYTAFREAIQAETPAKQMKLTEKFIRHNPQHRLSLKAKAQSAIDAELWGVAKETLTAYFNAYPTTPETARMMAVVERKGWHHEQGARSWEEKALSVRETDGWTCGQCHHEMTHWEAVCPMCNLLGSIKYK